MRKSKPSPGKRSVSKRPSSRRSGAEHPALTTPDLVLLSLLAERPLHGYEANLELERRQVRDWAGISKPQIYYSLEKLARAGLIRAAKFSPLTQSIEGTSGDTLAAADRASGPERRVFATTPQGRRALSAALEREYWTSQRDRPLFLTWLALSWQASPRAYREQLRRRRQYLERELAREKATLRAVLAEVGHRHHEALWMLSLVIEQFKTELRWLRGITREIPLREKAQNPA